MEKILNLSLENTTIGTLTAENGDMHITFTAHVPTKLSGIVRAYVSGGGNRVLVGVLSPCSGGFSVKKTLSKSFLRTHGITFENLSGAYASFSSSVRPDSEKKEVPGWTAVGDPCPQLRRFGVTKALAESIGALTDDRENPSCLAVLLLHDKPFPRPDVLCLMTPKRIDGTMYAVCKLSKSGDIRRM